MQKSEEALITFYEICLAVGHFHARQMGLNHDDASDCAQDFVLQLVTRKQSTPLLACEPKERLSRLHCYARNHVYNTLRTLRRRDRRECLGLYSNQNEMHMSEKDAPIQPDMNFVLLLEAEFWQVVTNSLYELDATPRSLFVKHYIYGQSIAELAITYKKTPNAIVQSLHRTRLRLRKLIELQELDIDKLR